MSLAPERTPGTATAETVEAPVLDLGGVSAPNGDLAPIASEQDAAIVPHGAPLTLRVLGGPLEGAEAALPEGDVITVGRGFRNTVVLRDKSVGETRISLEAKGPIATLCVLSGEAVLLGRRLPAPAEIALPHYLPVAIGASSFAVGETGHARWEECGAILPLVTATPANDAAPRAPKRGWLRGTALGAGVVGALGAAAVLFAPQKEAPPATPAAVLVGAVVEEGGFAEVVVDEREGDRVALAGFVATDARKAELRQDLDALGVDYTARVRSGEAAARQVSDLFAAGGTPGTARYAGGGAVVVSGVTADAATADRLRARALQDVPFLTGVRIERAEPAPQARSAAWTAEIVHSEGGEFAHVVTRDGARFFKGGSTPMGGKIVDIGEGSITIKEGGVLMRHVF